ncbi:MAG: branched-chain amino acid ABC transporter permease [Halanaerobiales bacterium]|nr:branched-chain amino acid ABC transporter permease [Halanaerobiales bacterium]
MFLLQQIINGIAQGSIYALMAMGTAMIIGIVGLVSFVQGEVIMIGAFAGYFVYCFIWSNFLFALFAGFAASWVMGIVIEKMCYKPFRRSPREIALICTIGLSILLKSLAQIVFGTQQKLMPDVLGAKYFAFGTIRISYIQILIIGIVILFSWGLQLLFYRTKVGISIRAVSMDKDAAALLGINVNRTILLGNSIACAFGGVAGVLLGIYYNSVHPIMGATASMKAFTAAVFGGLGSIPGAAIGGLLLGVLENLGVAFLSSGYRDIISFGILILVLIIKPSGIMGRKGEL